MLCWGQLPGGPQAVGYPRVNTLLKKKKKKIPHSLVMWEFVATSSGHEGHTCQASASLSLSVLWLAQLGLWL